GPQPVRPRRSFHVERSLDRPREREAIGNRAVARTSGCKPCGLSRIGAGHQSLDALVNIAKPGFKPHDGLAVGSQAEMAGLDDAGMDGADGNLVHAGSIDGKERIAFPDRGRLRSCGQRMAYVPVAMVKPGPGVERSFGFEAVEIADGAFEAQRGGVMHPDRGVATLRTIERDHADSALRLVEQRHVDAGGFSPEPEQLPRAFDKSGNRLVPDRGGDDRAWPGALARCGGAVVKKLVEVHHRHPRICATWWNHATSTDGRNIPATSTRPKCTIIGV